MNSSFKRFAILLILAVLTVTAFRIRYGNFVQSRSRSIDEEVYFALGHQMAHNFFDYNTIAYGQELAEGGRSLPAYFFAPLFKYPPGFPLLIMAVLKMFGGGFLTAGIVPALLGALMIPLIYGLGTLFFDRRIGLTAALLLWLDPVNIICSQKVWMDIPIAFWTLLAAVFFAAGLSRSSNGTVCTNRCQGWFFILSGLAAGIATNTKYTGIFITVAIGLYALLYDRKLLRSRFFRLSLVLPLVMLVPWAIWNMDIYGKDFLLRQAALNIGLKSLFHRLGGYETLFLALLAAIIIGGIMIMRAARRHETASLPQPEPSGGPDGRVVRYFSWLILCIVFFLILFRQLYNAMCPFYIPVTSWYMGTFQGRPLSFYFGRLLEFSPFYIFAVADLFLYHPEEKPGHAFLRIASWLILLFFIAWGNFQSRYIVSALPFLLLLSADMIHRIYGRILSCSLPLLAQAGRLAFLVFLAYAAYKTMYINLALSFPNNFCYF